MSCVIFVYWNCDILQYVIALERRVQFQLQLEDQRVIICLLSIFFSGIGYKYEVSDGLGAQKVFLLNTSNIKVYMCVCVRAVLFCIPP